MVTRVAILYAIGFVIWRLLVASPLAARWWPLQVSDLVAVWLLLPVPVLLLLGLRWPSIWLVLALSVPLLWFGQEYGVQFVPQTATRANASVGDDSLRVMTLNTWTNSDRDGAFATAVRDWQPDVIALQEIGPTFKVELDNLADEWPYQVRTTVRSASRVALLSKFPILSQEADNERSGCHCLHVTLDRHGTEIEVILVHIRAPSLGVRNRRADPLQVHGFDASEQDASYAALVSQVRESDKPLIVLGDFNTTERQVGYNLMYSAGLRNAHQEAGRGFGFTYPAGFSRAKWLPVPIIRIDHVFYDEHWQATQTSTHPLMGSDHEALLVDLRWVGRE